MPKKTEPKIIIVAGDVLEGHCFVGPFPDFKAAEAFTEKHMDDESVLLIELLSPQEYIEMQPTVH